MSRKTMGFQIREDHTEVTVKRKREPLLPRAEFAEKPFDYKASAEDTLKRFPKTMEYLGR